MKYTVCENGVTILCDGHPFTMTQTLGQLNFLDRLLKENDNYEAALVKCKDKFELYEQNHLGEGAVEKAKANAEMVEMLRNLLVGN